jgi:hypothetical protein
VLPDGTAFDPRAAGAARLDDVRQYQRCKARGLSGAGLRRCAAAILTAAPAAASGAASAADGASIPPDSTFLPP